MSVPAEGIRQYNYATDIGELADRIAPPSTAYGLPGAAKPAAPATQAMSDKLNFPDTVRTATVKAGRKLDDTELEAIRSAYKDNHVTPGLWSQKGMSQGQFEAMSAAFDNNAERFLAKYRAEEEDGKAGGKKDKDEGYSWGRAGRGALDALASFGVGATVGLGSDVLKSLDYVARAGNSAISAMSGKGFEEGWAGNTFLGDWAESAHGFGQGVEDEFTSEETKKTAAEFGRMMQDDTVTPAQMGKYLVDNPSAAAGSVGATIAALMPAKWVTKIPKVIEAVSLMEKGGPIARLLAKNVGTIAAGVPMTANAGADHERRIMAMSTEELDKDPGNKALHDSLIELQGPGAATDKRYKEVVASRGVLPVMGGSAIANILFPAGNPLSAEKFLAGRIAGTGSRLGTTAKAVGADIVEESLSAAPETMGANIGEAQSTGADIPVSRGVAKNMLLSGILSPFITGPVAAAHGGVPAKPKPSVDTEGSGDEPPPNTTVTGPTNPTATPANQQTPGGGAAATYGDGIEEGALAAGITKAVDKAKGMVAGKGAVAKGIAELTEPKAVITNAKGQASKIPGWEKMTALQQLDAIEAVAEVFSKKAKVSVAVELAKMRAELNAPPVAATPTVTEQPIPAGLIGEPTAQVAGEPPVAAAPVVEPAPVAAKLPPALSGAKPRYAFSGNNFDLAFEEDGDKALYIVSQTRPSKADTEYLKWIQENLGFDEATARSKGAEIRKQIKALASVSKPADGPLRIPATPRPAAAAPVAAKPVAARPAPVELPPLMPAPSMAATLGQTLRRLRGQGAKANQAELNRLYADLAGLPSTPAEVRARLLQAAAESEPFKVSDTFTMTEPGSAEEAMYAAVAAGTAEAEPAKTEPAKPAKPTKKDKLAEANEKKKAADAKKLADAQDKADAETKKREEDTAKAKKAGTQKPLRKPAETKAEPAKPAETKAEPAKPAEPFSPSLPPELAKAKTEYKGRPLNFARDFDKALFIVTHPVVNAKTRAKYVAWLESVRVPEAAAKIMGANLLSNIESIAKATKGNSALDIPAQGKLAETKTEPKKEVPKPPDKLKNKPAAKPEPAKPAETKAEPAKPAETKAEPAKPVVKAAPTTVTTQGPFSQKGKDKRDVSMAPGENKAIADALEAERAKRWEESEKKRLEDEAKAKAKKDKLAEANEKKKAADAKKLADAQDKADAETKKREEAKKKDEKAEKAGPKNLKKDTKPPKTDAPTSKTEAGAQDTKGAPARESSADAVARIMGDELGPDEAADLASALDVAREGDTAALNDYIKELEAGGVTVSKTQAAALREAGKSLTPAERGASEPVKPAEEPYVVETVQEGAARVLEAAKGKNPEQMLEWLSKNGPDPAYRLIATKVLGRMRQLQKIGAKFTTKYVPPSQVPGASKRSIALSDLTYLLGGMKSGKMTVDMYFGNDPTADIPGTRFPTMLHEYIHAVSTIFQNAARDPKFRGGILSTEIGKATVEIEALYNHVVRTLKAKPESDLTDFEKGALDGTVGNALANQYELITWGLVNKDMQQMLRNIQMPPTKGGVIKTAWSELVTIVRNMMGVTDANENALDRVLSLTENLLEGNLDEWMNATATTNFLATPDNDGSGQTPQTNQTNPSQGESGIATAEKVGKVPDLEKPKHVSISIWQKLGEWQANATYGLERAVQAVTARGGDLTTKESDDINPYYAGRKYGSDISEIAAVDNEEVVAPLANWIKTNYSKFSDTPEEFRKGSDQFLQAYHELHERIPDMWLQQVPLNDGNDINRNILIDEVNAGEITPKEFYTQLKALVNKEASQSLEEWAKQSKNAKDLSGLRSTLAKLKAKGFDEHTMAEYNKLFEAARQRLQEHMIASGRISENDPWVKARNWKWYVPLKGSRSASDESADYDYGMDKGGASEFRKRSIAVAKGRADIAGSVAEQLITDMNQEGIKRAEAEFKASLFGFIQKYKDLMGDVKITVWEGTPKLGYTSTVTTKNKKTGARGTKQKFAKELPSPAYGFVFNQGDTHFSITLDMKNEIGANLDRGIKGFNNTRGPRNKFMRGWSKVTNFMSRAYTTYSPEWQFYVGFARDLNYIPITLSMEIFENPLQSGTFYRGYMKRVFGNTLAIANLKQSSEEVFGQKDKLRKRAVEDPDSFMGQLFAYREAGGSTEQAQALNLESANELLFKAAEKQGLKGTALKAYEGFNDLTGNWAQLLENRGRVAAYTTLVKDLGFSPRKAAAMVKGVMDFGQSGEYGRQVNAVISFYRVGMTGADVMRRIFSTPTGKPNWPKLTKWSMFMGGMAATAYAMMAMALGDDDDGVPKIKKYDINTLTQKLIVPTGDGDVATYPIGLGLPQLLLAPGTIGAAWKSGNITAQEAVNAYYEVLTRNAPFQPAGWEKGTGAPGFATSWVTGLVPTIFRPVVETTYNLSPFDTPIHTPFKNEDKFKSEQGMRATPHIYKEWAEELRETMGVDTYPENIKHWMSGYLGQNFTSVMRQTVANMEKEDQGLDPRPVRSALRLSAVDPDFYYSRELKKVRDVLLTTKKREDAAKDNKTESAFYAQPGVRQRLAELKKVESAQKKYYDALDTIREANMTPQGKKDRRKLAESVLRQATESAQRVIEATE